MSRSGLNRSLLFLILLLSGYGLAMVYSSGQTDVPTFAKHAWIRQTGWMAMAIVAGAITYRISFRLLEWAAPYVYVFGCGLLVLTLLIGTGAGTAASSKSWLAIGGVRLGQPVEFMKLATVLLLARYLAGLRQPPQTLRDLVKPGLIAGLPFLLVMAQPDLGSAIVLISILFVQLFWAGVRPSLLLLLASPVVSLVLAVDTRWWGAWIMILTLLLLIWRTYVSEGVFIWLVNSAMGVVAIVLWHRLKPYQQQRLISFVNPEADPIHSGYQAIQSKVAIGSGGWVGNGWLHGPQKRLAFLPEQPTDFIFSVVGEELGFVGVLAALVLFFLLFVTLVRIARRATDTFSSLVVFGVLGILFTHVFENVGMTINLMPITGIPLPFFSYGGSFILACGVAMGLCLRVSWDSRLSGYAE
jgi:rod shape determining protein RodA